MRRDAHEVGTATEASDLSLEALRAALVRARSAALVDPHFPGLPGTPRKFSPNSAGPAEAAAAGLMRVGDAPLVEAAWRIVGGAIEAFTMPPAARHRRARARPALGGDVSMMRDLMALASSNSTCGPRPARTSLRR